MGELISTKLASLRISNSVGAGGRGPVKAIISYVLMIFVLFIFATSGLISNSNIQTQLKNSAYYLALFASVIGILVAVSYIQRGTRD